MPPRARLLVLATAYLGFISLGLPDTLFGVAWPSIRRDFGLPLGNAGAAFIATGLAYGTSAALAGKMLGTFGVGRLLFASSALVTLAVWGFSASPAWMLFVLCALFHGFGSGAIDTGLNHHASGHFSAKHMNWLHAAFGLGAALGPAVMTTALVGNSSWRAGYAAVGAALAALSVMFFFTRRQWTGAGAEAARSLGHMPLVGSLAQPAVRRQIVVFFFYAGFESAAGQWSFTLLSESRGLSTGAAGSVTSGYWAALFVGRILAGFVVEGMGPSRLVKWSCAGAVAGAALVAAPLPTAFGLAGVFLIGFSLAPVFPCLMTLTPMRVGERHSANSIGLQVTAATAGISLLPAGVGWVAQRAGVQTIPWMWLSLALVLAALEVRRRREC